jgi:hypothetical protein
VDFWLLQSVATLLEYNILTTQVKNTKSSFNIQQIGILQKRHQGLMRELIFLFGLIRFQYINATDEGDFTELFYRAYKQAISSDYSKEYKVIEQPSFLTIDGHKAGTYLYTTKDKYEDDAVTMARQDWIVTAGDHFYLIGFGALPNVFDTPELTEVRDHLIKSIHFTNSNNATTKNIPNRFS